MPAEKKNYYYLRLSKGDGDVELGSHIQDTVLFDSHSGMKVEEEYNG